MKVENGYGNFKIYSPNNELMFKPSIRKLNFYLKNNLIEQIGDKEYRLLFEPKGKGWSDEDKIKFSLSSFDRKNICICSGESDIRNLTKHHIVPCLFRKQFRKKDKNNFQFLVLIRTDLHYQYTIYEQEMYNTIADYYNIERLSVSNSNYVRTIMRPFHLAKNILKYGDTIPKESFERMKAQFEETTNIPATIENFKKYLQDNGDENGKCKLYKTTGEYFGKKIVEKITDIQQFEMMWLRHFIETMRPKFLPEDLQILAKENNILI